MHWHRLMRTALSVLAAGLLLAAGSAAAQTIYVARVIHTMNGDRDTATAVAVEGGYIRAVGALASVQAAVGSGYAVDSATFRGQVLLPGFVEAHTHLQFYGLFSRVPYVGYFDRPGPDSTLKGIQTEQDIIPVLQRAVRDQYDSTQDSTLPLLASGADPIYFGGTRFTKAFLDSVSSTTPILLQLGSGHIVVVNTPMLHLLQGTPGWSDLPAASVIRDANRDPTGELDELQAVDFAFMVFLGRWAARYPPYGFTTPLRMSRAIVDGGTMMQRAGITTATEMLFGSPAARQELGARALYDSTVAAPGFPVRVVLAYDAQGLRQAWGPDGMVAALQKARALDTDMLRTGLVKIIFDGSIQGYTAQLQAPGYIRPGYSNPMWNVQPDSLRALVQPFVAAGFPLAIHVNGDSASGLALQTLRAVQPAGPPGRQWPGGPDSVWAALQHHQITRPDQYRQARTLNVGMNLFANHIYYYGQQHVQYTIGLPRADSMNAAALAQQLGIPYSLHSDAPVTPALPLFAAWVATERLPAACLTATPTPDYCPLGKEQRITVDQALYAITMGGATLLNMAGEVGSIEAGKRADFVALGADPYALPNDMRLKDVPVLATMVGGALHPVTP